MARQVTGRTVSPQGVFPDQLSEIVVTMSIDKYFQYMTNIRLIAYKG
jgi:hypothetical protein